MTNFEIFCMDCKNALSFACQIFLKNNKLELIKNDLDALNKIDESQIVYFKGAFQLEEGVYLYPDAHVLYSFVGAETDARVDRMWGGDEPP
jgi:hypothetical protein